MFTALRPATIISPDDRLDKILKKMGPETSTFVVVGNGKYLGIINDRTFRSIQGEPDSKIAGLVWNAPVIRPDMKLDEISECFLQGYKELPVCEDGKVLGILKHIDILNYLLENGRIPSHRASEIMSSPVITMEEDNSLSQAASVMKQNNVHHLVVVDKSGKMTGMVSTADLAPMLERLKDRPPFVREKMGLWSIQLGTVVMHEIHTVRLGSILPEVAKEMIKNDISSLVVYDEKEEKPVGLVHIFDIIRSSLPTSDIRFEIVGLDPEDKEYRDDIKREGVKALQKIDQIFPVEGGKLTVKKFRKEGSRAKYSMKFQIMGKERISVEASEWDLFKTLHQVIKEATRITKETKSKRKGKKDGYGKMRSFVVKIRKGDISFGRKA